MMIPAKQMVPIVVISTTSAIVWVLLSKATAEMQSVPGSLVVRWLPVLWLCTILYLVLRHWRQPS